MYSKIAIELHNNLLNNEQLLNAIMESRGLSLETIKKYKIGYCNIRKRYSIPIGLLNGVTANLRMYDKNSEAKMISYEKGSGEVRLFPMENLHNREEIFICEGEWDCLVLNQYGFNAITNTGGANTWKPKWNDLFRGVKKVYIVYDCDEVGRTSAMKVANNLTDYVNELRIIDLKLEDKGDITDFFIKYKKNKEEFIKLLNSEKFDNYKLVSLQDSLNANHYDKDIKFYGVIMGKDLSPYIIPSKVKASCSTHIDAKKAICDTCPLCNNPIEATFTYTDNKDLLVQMIKSNDMQVLGYIRQVLKIPAGRVCPGSWKMEYLERINIEEILLVPEIDNAKIDEKVYVQRTGYYFGYNLQTNQSYLFKGTTWADPYSQTGIHLIEEAKGSKDDISKFQLDEDMKRELRKFQPKDSSLKAIEDKINEIQKDLFLNVTRMWKRENIIFATNLVYHSVLGFDFMGERIQKGWLECTIVGDTRCGKSETIKRLVKHFQAGEYVSTAEHATEAGLIGGLQQSRRGSWTITWGKLVMNNRRICILDEADELSKKDIIGKLSSVRSNGVAELVKIQSQRAMAQTRLIFISNPLWGRMSEHNFGVEVVREIFKAPQDISRIDFAIGIAKEEVDDRLINQPLTETVENVFTSELCNLSVMFAWSRKPDDIIFEQEAVDTILNVSNSMARDFSFDIPLVVGAEMRIKLARMSVALACWLYSTDGLGEKVIVKSNHVLMIANYLYSQYDNPVMGYKEFSEQRERDKEIGNTKDIDWRITDKETCDLLLDMGKIQAVDIGDVFDLDISGTRELVAYMRKNRLLKRKGSFYVKTPGFIEHLKKLKKEIENKILDLI